MEVCLDFHGYRVTAQPLLDFAEEIVYGSGDGGHTVACDAELHDVLLEVGERLHLAEHGVKGSAHRLAIAADIEVKRLKTMHTGPTEAKDGSSAAASATQHAYLLDLARGFPPSSPFASAHLPVVGQPVFYRMLRPELLAQLRRAGKVAALSPDALSAFGGDGAEARAHNVEVHKATQYLLSEVIPSCMATLLASGRRDGECPGVGEWSSRLHAVGINMRHLGLLRHEVCGTIAGTVPKSVEIAESLLAEMVARAVKRLARYVCVGV